MPLPTALTSDDILRALAGSMPASDPVSIAFSRLPAGQAATLYPDPLIPAAVLIPLIERPDGIGVILTRRTDHLKDHPGQISFPGGRLELTDASPLAAALREMQEEMGVDPAVIQVAGYIAPHAVITGFVVSPVVAFLPPDVVFRPDPYEVAEVFEVPLAYFRDPATLSTTMREVRGLNLTVYTWDYEGRRIWGATAHMIKSLCEIVYGSSR